MMINDNDFFLDRIKKITEPVQQKYLHDVLHEVFKGYVEYSNSKYLELEKRIETEIPDDFKNYYIYTAAAKRDDFTGLSNFWSEVCGLPEDETEASVFKRIFVNCGHELIKPYIDKFITADIKTDKNEYTGVRLKVKFSQVYQDGIKRLYDIFALNGRQWLTINCPFMFKFLDLIDEGGSVPKDETVTEYILKDFGIDKYIINDMVLLWNVHKYSVKSKANPYPTKNMLRCEHKIKLEHIESEYLFSGAGLENFEILKYRDRENIISLISDGAEGNDDGEIIVYRIAENPDNNVRLAFLPQSNLRQMRHTDRQAGKYGSVFTRAELERICGSYGSIGSSLRLADVSVDGFEDCEGCRDLNYFIKINNIDMFKKNLVLKFNALDETDDIFLHEKMWFLVSEIQLYFNEYKCIGKII
jgi:hypothetical protein